MQTSKAGIEMIEQLEGSRSHMYLDVAGFPTIGVGHLLERAELLSGKIWIGRQSVDWRNGLTKIQIQKLLAHDLKKFEQTVNEKVRMELFQSEFDALVSFSFNIGQKAFSDSTLLSHLNRGWFNKVPEQFKRWKWAGGRIVQGLINRRKREVAMFLSEWTIE